MFQAYGSSKILSNGECGPYYMILGTEPLPTKVRPLFYRLEDLQQGILNQTLIFPKGAMLSKYCSETFSWRIFWFKYRYIRTDQQTFSTL